VDLGADPPELHPQAKHVRQVSRTPDQVAQGDARHAEEEREGHEHRTDVDHVHEDVDGDDRKPARTQVSGDPPEAFIVVSAAS
jgi:hypothetical protein